MALLDLYDKSTADFKKLGKNSTSGFTLNEQQGNPTEFDLTKVDIKDTNGNATAPYTSKKTYEDTTPRK